MADERELRPGSPEAGEAGCRCPVMDNAYGRGWMGGVEGADGETIYVVSGDCPIHVIPAPIPTGGEHDLDPTP